TTMGGCQCFRQAEAYIRQFPAPLAIYPLRVALGFTFHFLLGLTIAVLVTAALHGLGNGMALFSLAPSLALILGLGWSLALLGGLVNVLFPDTGHIVEIVFHGLFYLTPILYSKEWIAGSPELTAIVRYNPLSYFLRLLRDPILDGH